MSLPEIDWSQFEPPPKPIMTEEEREAKREDRKRFKNSRRIRLYDYGISLAARRVCHEAGNPLGSNEYCWIVNLARAMDSFNSGRVSSRSVMKFSIENERFGEHEITPMEWASLKRKLIDSNVLVILDGHEIGKRVTQYGWSDDFVETVLEERAAYIKRKRDHGE